MSEIKPDPVTEYLKKIGAKGGKKSRRSLSPEQARRMVAVREARKAYRKYKQACFWSSPEDLVIQYQHVPLIVKGLREQGDRDAFVLAGRLRRLCASQEM